MIFRLSQKLNKKIKAGPLKAVPLDDNPYADWSCHLFTADRAQYTYKGQMELYLRWLEKHDTQPGEQTPLGLILCADKSKEQIELLRLDESGIHVAAYLTELPPPELLKQKLHEAVRTARARLEASPKEDEEL